MSKKPLLIGLFFLVGMSLLLLFPYFFIDLELVGKETIKIEYQDTYEELGATSSFLSIPLEVEQTGSFEEKKVGEQTITYQVSNLLGPIKKVKRKIKVVDKTPPVIVLKGDSTIELEQGSDYTEPGYTMYDAIDGNITEAVKVTKEVDTKEAGTYQVIYQGQDASKNKVTAYRTVKVLPKILTYQDAWDDISNDMRTWWSGNKKDNKRPTTGAGATEEELKPYNSYYMGEDKKVIYLTFDEGSNDTYTKEIIEVLNKNKVKGTFFFCEHYITSNPDVMKLLAKTGHSVGNHTANHETMSKYANRDQLDTFIKEVKDVEEAYQKITGKAMDKVYREPRGEFSLRSLAIIKELGYQSYFWSADYLDWNGDVSKEEALDNLMKRYHNGAIYLIHPKNKGNYEAMDTFIKEMKKLGYEFGLVKDIHK